MILREEPCVTCGEREFHLNHFAFVGNTPISGGHTYEQSSDSKWLRNLEKLDKREDSVGAGEPKGAKQ